MTSKNKRTIFVADMKYKDNTFTIHYDLGYDFPDVAAVFLFEEGNYSCDCNRSSIIRKEYGKNAIEQLNCGENIEMIDYHIEYWQ